MPVACFYQALVVMTHEPSPGAPSGGLLQALLTVRNRPSMLLFRPTFADPALFLSRTPRTILAFYVGHCDMQLVSGSWTQGAPATFLHRLSEHGTVRVIPETVALPLVQTLITLGVNVDASGRPEDRARFTGTPLMTAIYSGRFQIAHVLIEAGANVSGSNAETTAAFMLDEDRRMTPMKWAAQRDDTGATIELLLQHGAPVNDPDCDGWTSFSCAVRHRNLAAMQVLYLHGADINYPDHQGVTPLMAACAQPDNDVITALLAMNGADGRVAVDLFARDVEGQTALDKMPPPSCNGNMGAENAVRAAMGLGPRRRCVAS